MKRKPIWKVTATIGLPLFAVIALTAAFWFWNPIIFYVISPITLAICVYCIWKIAHVYRTMRAVVQAAARQLNIKEQEAMSSFSIPVLISSEDGEILWYSDTFRKQVAAEAETFGARVEDFTEGRSVNDLKKKSVWEAAYMDRHYRLHITPVVRDNMTLWAIYFIDITAHVLMTQRYEDSRPVLMLIYIDNLEELLQNSRNSERAQISGKVETLLEDWATAANGVLQRYDDDRFIALFHQKSYEAIVEQKLDILDRVRSLQVGEHNHVTLSIGVGCGESFTEAEMSARQSLDMALGRGGDQAAVRTKNGYNFYGGLSKGVEKRNKVRTRIVASALEKLINESNNVLVMGHRFSDLDCLGSGCALVSLIRNMGKEAHLIVNRQTTLADELLARYDATGKSDYFIDGDSALHKIDERTLLIVTDTQTPTMLEAPQVYQQAPQTVVIDHHRKMVEHIENAIIFYHEPYASSASEMISELAQYMSREPLSKLDAEALLGGIMLDTRSFVMKAGVRTFEAAAYLKKCGADTVEVKRLFAGSMELYRRKSDIISTVYMYRNKAIAFGEEGGTDIRIAASQAADELLSIQGVDAAFAMFPEGNGVNISARSMGDFNVQLTMEALGGGGHLNMAGAFLANNTLEQAQERLREAIDEQMKTLENTLSSQEAQ